MSIPDCTAKWEFKYKKTAWSVSATRALGFK